MANWYIQKNPLIGPHFNKPFFFFIELGGIAIAPHPYQDKEDLKPGFIMKPSFGVVPCLIDKDVICLSVTLTTFLGVFLQYHRSSKLVLKQQESSTLKLLYQEWEDGY